MKRFSLLFAVLFCFTAASAAMAAEFEPVIAIDDPGVIATPDLVATFYTLDVTNLGRGSVVSNPEGISCNNDGATTTGTCSANFVSNTVVALLATYPEPDDFGSYFFCGWNGDPDNSADVYGVLMDADKSVEAQFCALGVPPYLIPMPASWDMYGPYVPVGEPVIYADLEDMKPIAILNRDDGGVNIFVDLPYFGDGSVGVDVYAAITIEGVLDVFLFNSTGGITSLSGGLVPWKQNITGELHDETLLEIPGAFMALLPPGIYHVHLMVTPTGSTATYYYWITYFENLPFLINPFFLTP